ncbi:hypothetical protein BS329_15685 [Amycolatopsis coloradensis]|uniref:Uncharacterized protein n=1 Tax=Amycolatopsis coloradensis TaxID=76021 RepID=A0A1R0KUB5_9PSEU|nr:hypothetical protein BS329_15685 [Amycolatopsis coloradensis]
MVIMSDVPRPRGGEQYSGDPFRRPAARAALVVCPAARCIRIDRTASDSVLVWFGNSLVRLHPWRDSRRIGVASCAGDHAISYDFRWSLALTILRTGGAHVASGMTDKTADGRRRDAEALESPVTADLAG